ncbi:hypothetical protein [Bradyrhizobium sp. RT5a]|uniref:hypothetical protein n=1 Tax=unclassified Bradyrhizobium TaxID=2631580 RepID=UPI003396869A
MAFAIASPPPISSCQAVSQANRAMTRWGTHAGYARYGAEQDDADDANGLSHLAEVGVCRQMWVKSFDSMLVRTLAAARNQLLKMTTQLSHQIRGLMKTFGLVVPKGQDACLRAVCAAC